jgi:4a-hydroxytetrahydrobiopterin dehydratase
MWTEKNNELVRQFKFEDFKQAFDFMVRVAALSEKLDHHPWWSNVYDQVTIKLSTHSAGGKVTDKDRGMAEEIDKIWLAFQSE